MKIVIFIWINYDCQIRKIIDTRSWESDALETRESY